MRIGTFVVVGAIVVGAGCASRAGPLAAQESTATRQAEVDEILSHMSLVEVDDGKGHLVKTLRISGVNVQIVNGAGKTLSVNGAGNLIVGYNETGNPGGDDRSGSHSIVVGQMNSFGNAGCLVAGESNDAGGTFSSVIGGSMNSARGTCSSVVGGSKNVASGSWSTVLAGEGNEAAGSWSTVTGRKGNVARDSWQVTPDK